MPIYQNEGFQQYYESVGEGPALLLIHGLGSSAKDWESQIAHFSKSYRVIAVDVRGHGLTDKPPGPYSVAQFAADVRSLLLELGIQKASVAGLSMGGMIAFQMAVDEPGIFEKIIIINSAPAFSTETRVVKNFVKQRRFVIRWFGFKYFCGVMAARLFPGKDQQEMKAIFLERWLKNDRKGYKAAFDAIVDWSVMSKIPRIEVPVLVVHAEMDYTPLKFKEAYAARMSFARVVTLPNSRHMSSLDQPDALNMMMEEFLRS